MSLAATILASAIVLQSGAGRAEVTFINDSKFPVSIFLKEHRKTFGPIEPGDFVQIPNGFKLGENDYLVVRQIGERSSLREFAAVSPARHRLYSAGAGRPPAPVRIEFGNEIFRTLKDETRAVPLKIENNTAYPVFATAQGRASSFGPVFAGKTNRFASALRRGKTEMVVVAYADARPDGQVSDKIVDVAFVSMDTGRSATAAPTLVVTDRTFGPRGLPPKAAPPAPTPPTTSAPRLSIEGKWRMPDGLSVRFEGSNGYWIEVKHLADFGFKPGDHGFRALKEDADRPGTFVGEVRYRRLGGEEAGWSEFSVTVVNRDTLRNAAGEWKRID